VSFAAITLCIASQRVFIVVIVYFVMTQSGNFWIHPRSDIMVTVSSVPGHYYIKVYRGVEAMLVAS
jgi:hypothetical protein